MMIPVVGVFVVAIQRGLLDVISWQSINFLELGIYIFLIVLAIFSILFLLLALLSVFSRINITQEGLDYENLISKGTIHLEEISTITSSKLIKPLRFVVIQRKGTTFFRPQGLLFQLIHGVWAGVYKPVIVLWNNVIETENWIRQIKN